MRSFIAILLVLGCSTTHAEEHFQLSHFETDARIVVNPVNGQLVVRSRDKNGTVWHIDGGMLKSSDGRCVHTRQDDRLELATCDGNNDYRLCCPGDCAYDDQLRQNMCVGYGDSKKVAVWGDHDEIWTGMGRAALDYLMNMQKNEEELSILVAKSFTKYGTEGDDFGTKWTRKQVAE